MIEFRTKQSIVKSAKGKWSNPLHSIFRGKMIKKKSDDDSILNATSSNECMVLLDRPFFPLDVEHHIGIFLTISQSYFDTFRLESDNFFFSVIVDSPHVGTRRTIEYNEYISVELLKECLCEKDKIDDRKNFLLAVKICSHPSEVYVSLNR